MIVSKKLQVLFWVIGIALFVYWWFVVADWIATPHSPRAGIFYLCVVIFSSSWHFRALRRFSKMTRLLRAEEKAGIAPPGSTTFAANQRFRYLMRSVEAIVVLTIGVLAIVATYNPAVQFSPNYIRLVLTYFIGSVLLTGFLTIRDLWVINRVKELNASQEDAATLQAIKAETSVPSRP